MASQKISHDQLRIINTLPQYADGACQTIRLAYRVDIDEACDTCMKPQNIQQHIEQFPQGQFVAVYTPDDESEIVVGMAVTMRTSRPPTEKALPWIDAIGNLNLPNHESDGDWLYGVEMAVRPMYHRNGIGTRLYQARFELVKRLNLRGWYTVGMLMGYQNYADLMDVLTYGNKVIAGDIQDPTVTMQMNRGFQAKYVVKDYSEEPSAGDTGVLIVWENPDNFPGE